MNWTKAGKPYLMDLMVRMAHHSTAIEGNTLTLGDTRTILINGIVPKTTKLRELYEVINYKKLLPFLLENGHQDISITSIHEINKILMENIDKRGGHFKEVENMIVGASFVPTHPSLVPSALHQWCENLSWRLEHSSTDEEKISAIMDHHIQFEKIHPFADGNGRTGRALIIMSCIHEELIPIIIEKEQRDEYIALLNNEDREGLTALALEIQKKEKKHFRSYQQVRDFTY